MSNICGQGVLGYDATFASTSICLPTSGNVYGKELNKTNNSFLESHVGKSCGLNCLFLSYEPHPPRCGNAVIELLYCKY